MNPLHIIELRAENVKRLRLVSIKPDGNLIIIGGDNGEGKSSLLDSIAMALGGKDQIPIEPVRRGAKKASVILDLGEIIVKRTFTSKGGTGLVVEKKDGSQLTSPQAVLDRLTTLRTFDPLVFLRMGENPEGRRKQAATLQSVAQLDFTKLNEKRAAAETKRTDANRQLKGEMARLEALPHYTDAPAEEVSVVKVSAEIEAAQNHNLGVKQIQDMTGIISAKQAQAEAESLRQAHVIEALQAQLKVALKAEAAANTQKVELATEFSRATAAAKKAQETVIDIAPLREKIAEAETINRCVAANRQWTAASSTVRTLTAQADKLNVEIEDVDELKAIQLAQAKLPVPGLGFTDDGVTYKELPLEQASQAEQMRVSVAIAAALNPTLRVMLVRDGSLLDKKSLELLAKLAEEYDSQIWLESVSHGAECQVIMEDGMVQGDESASGEGETS